MMDVIYIFGAGEMGGPKPVIPSNAFVIAADAGLNYLRAVGIEPDLTVGDFDSLGKIPLGVNVVVHNPEKNETDMLLAANEALSRRAKHIVIYGGTGGRPDHEFANIQTLAYIANRGAKGYLIGRGSVITVIKNSSLAFPAQATGVISVFCVGDRAEGVDLTGLKYPLKNHTLSCDFPLGVSNEFIGAPSEVSVKNGLLAVMWSYEAFDFEAMLGI
ncbi:MAG: thiamine diphosphokinase [Clostridia bacterium]|nr:thiamine diphosphokinase [Clostridia bacterium]